MLCTKTTASSPIQNQRVLRITDCPNRDVNVVLDKLSKLTKFLCNIKQSLRLVSNYLGLSEFSVLFLFVQNKFHIRINLFQSAF